MQVMRIKHPSKANVVSGQRMQGIRVNIARIRNIVSNPRIEQIIQSGQRRQKIRVKNPSKAI